MIDQINMIVPLQRERCMIVGCSNSVPGARRREGDPVCTKHWRMAPKALRKRLYIVKLQIVRRGMTDERRQLFFDCWERIVATANQAQGGIG